jgi:hypothetical protein
MTTIFETDETREIQRLAYLEALSAIRREVDMDQKSFIVEVAKGRVPGHSLVHKFGRNPDTDSAASATAVPVGRDVWDGGIAGATAWVPPTTARIHDLVSDNDEDGGAGTDTGALTVNVVGLDAAYHLQEEVVTMNGVTNAPTTATFTMIHRMEVLSAGSAGRNLGNITATAQTDSTVTAKSTADMNQTLMAIYQVPAGKTGYVVGWYFGIGRTGFGAAVSADGFFMVKEDGEVWHVHDTATVSRDGQNWFDEQTNLAESVPAKGLIKIAADPSADAQDTHGGFDLILVDDGR